MKKPSLVVLEVGHGNAAVLLDTGGVVVIDAGQGGVLLDFLRATGVTVVDLLLISHADTDHIRNAPDLLLDRDIEVRRVCFNSDAAKDTRVWGDFREALRYGRLRKNLSVNTELTVAQPGKVRFGAVEVEVLYPTPDVAASGPGGRDVDGNRVTSNSMSAVVRLNTAAGPMVLLAGDAETSCLDTWASEKVDPSAPVLIFPHHGGHPGSDDTSAFATRFVRLVKPRAVIFSIHRTMHNLPLEEVVDAVRQSATDVWVACTQLSAKCAATPPKEAGNHLIPLPHTDPRPDCCAGTIVIDLSGSQPLLSPDPGRHNAFVAGLGSGPLCRRRVVAPPTPVVTPPPAAPRG